MPKRSSGSSEWEPGSGSSDRRRAQLVPTLVRCGNMVWMATWKFVALALKAQRGWNRIPPAQRRQIIENATKQARKHGPIVAKRAAEIARQVRKGQ
jgi:hypothetical protein